MSTFDGGMYRVRASFGDGVALVAYPTTTTGAEAMSNMYRDMGANAVQVDVLKYVELPVEALSFGEVSE